MQRDVGMKCHELYKKGKDMFCAYFFNRSISSSELACGHDSPSLYID